MQKQELLDDIYLDFCEGIQRMSKGAKYRVGAVIVKEGRPLVNGYNGTPPGYSNGTDLFDPERVWADEDQRVEHREWSAQYEVHAEMNALLYAARKGISVEGATLYCTLQPCHNCLKHMLCAGVKRVVYRYKHRSFSYNEETLNMVQSCGACIDHLPAHGDGINKCKTVQTQDAEKKCNHDHSS